jgi:hypothetical protein
MIAKTIKSILANNVALVALVPVARIYPYVMNEDTDLPAIIYTVDSLKANYTKGGWSNDDIEFSVHSFSKEFTLLQTIVSAVRTALELNQTGSGSQDINRIYLSSMDEGYDNNADVFFNTLIFNVVTNAY